jgi:hypothetical protein
MYRGGFSLPGTITVLKQRGAFVVPEFRQAPAKG